MIWENCVKMPIEIRNLIVEGSDGWRSLAWRYCSGDSVVIEARTRDEADQLETAAYLFGAETKDVARY